MAKKSSSSLSGLSVADLQRELNRRRRSLPSLQRKRQKLVEKIATIDAAITALGGATGGFLGRRSPNARGENNATLPEYLRRALTGNTMGVTEVAEAVQKLGYKTNSPNFRTIVNAALMNKKFGFKRVSRGQYTHAG